MPVPALPPYLIEPFLLWQQFRALIPERRGKVVDFWVAFSEVVIIVVRRLIQESWTCYLWEGRSSRRP
jgi:hypothetical protein